MSYDRIQPERTEDVNDSCGDHSVALDRIIMAKYSLDFSLSKNTNTSTQYRHPSTDLESNFLRYSRYVSQDFTHRYKDSITFPNVAYSEKFLGIIEFAGYNHQDTTFHNLFISVRRCTCFRRFFSSGQG